jgi:hypothetical protein
MWNTIKNIVLSIFYMRSSFSTPKTSSKDSNSRKLIDLPYDLEEAGLKVTDPVSEWAMFPALNDKQRYIDTLEYFGYRKRKKIHGLRDHQRFYSEEKRPDGLTEIYCTPCIAALFTETGKFFGFS